MIRAWQPNGKKTIFNWFKKGNLTMQERHVLYWKLRFNCYPFKILINRKALYWDVDKQEFIYNSNNIE